MHYYTVAEAREMEGLRLALTVQSPGPWGIAARTMFQLRGVPFVPVRQDAMEANEDLVAWTGRRNAPVAVWNDEAPVDGWLEIVNLAERLGEGPSLWPEEPLHRALAAGFSSEICGNDGFGWARRLGLIAPVMEKFSDAADGIAGQYGLRDDALEAADARAAQVLSALAAQLKCQAEGGSRYLVGERVSACDVHWAAFSTLVAPLDEADCPLDPGLRAMFSNVPPLTREALDPVLIAHRDHVFAEHIGLPLDYLPDED